MKLQTALIVLELGADLHQMWFHIQSYSKWLIKNINVIFGFRWTWHPPSWNWNTPSGLNSLLFVLPTHSWKLCPHIGISATQTFIFYGCQAMSVTLNLYLREFFVHIFQRRINMNIGMRLRNNGTGRVFGAVLVSKGREDSTQGTSKLQ